MGADVALTRTLRRLLPAATLLAVRSSVFNRCAVVILLMTRLVLGEFVHAHDAGLPAGGALSEVAVAQETAGCHDDAKQSSEPECCKTGGCECPCLFATAIGSGAAFALEAPAELRTPGCAAGAPLIQPFTLFRPPASLTPFA